MQHGLLSDTFDCYLVMLTKVISFSQVMEVTPLNIEHEKAGPEFGKKMPVIFYYHGGGFAVMCPNFRIYDVYCRRLARRCGALVLSVHYRQVTHLSNAPFSFIADHCFPPCKKR